MAPNWKRMYGTRNHGSTQAIEIAVDKCCEQNIVMEVPQVTYFSPALLQMVVLHLGPPKRRLAYIENKYSDDIMKAKEE